jgi:RNA polymerase sigma-70 factor, ECF subfamily
MKTSPYFDEAAIVKRIAHQDESALSQLYDRYARVLYAVAFKMLGTVEEAEEVVLDVFHQVWRIAVKYDAKKARVDTWLFMQVRSRSLDKLRARERAARTPMVSLDAMEVDTPSPLVNPDEDVVINERRTLVIKALKQLPQEQQQVLELAYFQGLSHGEIAAQTGIPLGTIKTRIRLALGKLRGAFSSFDISELG